ncbi:hypothetical protein GQ42DRAFT_180663 [Ramicandelaber brevisporus]|nr:hypothetical protein GQ42DRAFT_180663 [Ramicandelaber brevisporus]
MSSKKKSSTAAEEQQTSVLLGYSDAAIDPSNDVNPFDAKIGGRPVFLTSSEDEAIVAPNAPFANCDSCSNPMVLLLQASVPLDWSPFDRVLYVWGCNRRKCMGTAGAFKAIRGHAFNKEYAATLAKSKAAKQSRAEQQAKKQTPASVSAAAAATPAFDFGNMWGASGFGFASATLPENTPPSAAATTTTTAIATPGQAEDDLTKAMASASLTAKTNPAACLKTGDISDWSKMPCLPGVYLDVAPEILKRSTASDMDSSNLEDDALEELDDDKGNKEKIGWGGEAYEAAALPRGMDVTFERFAAVAAANPGQCIRYDFGGSSLLYTGNDAVAKLLRTSSAAEDEEAEDEDALTAAILSSSSSSTSSSSHKRATNKSYPRVPKCEGCGGSRVFECQLMPSMITDLDVARFSPDKFGSKETGAKAEQKNAKADLLAQFNRGMEFGTIMVFTCENDCHEGVPAAEWALKQSASVAYIAEQVYVQLEAN